MWKLIFLILLLIVVGVIGYHFLVSGDKQAINQFESAYLRALS